MISGACIGGRETVVVNKIDFLPHLDFDLDELLANLDDVNPGVARLLVSAKTGVGIDAWRDWLVAAAARRPAGARSASPS